MRSSIPREAVSFFGREPPWPPGKPSPRPGSPSKSWTPVTGISREFLHNHQVDRRTEVQVVLCVLQWNGRGGQQLREHFTRRARGVRQTAREQEITDRSETVLVRSRGYELSRKCLRGDVHQSSHKEAGPGEPLVRGCFGVSRDSEIE